ncbi:MAG: hypothetical protein ISR44_10090 [Rhodospirillales bacterium]|nr:hypothetical protein [Rhodospirillales bacterium]
MAWEQYIDQEYNCVVVVHKGQWDDVEPLFQLKDLVNRPDHREGMNILRDMRRAQFSSNLNYNWFSAQRSAFLTIDGKLGKCRIANVVGSEAQFGIINQIRLIMDDTWVARMPFMDMLEAKRWLGLPDDYGPDLVPNEITLPFSVK